MKPDPLIFTYRKAISQWISLLLVAAITAGCAGKPAPAAAPTAASSPASQPSPETQAWLQAAQLGPNAPAQQDWTAIEKAANQEGKLVVYVPSAAYKDAGKVFMEKYPQIQVEMIDLTSTELNQRLREEQKSAVYNADVYLNPDYGETLQEFLPQGYLWNFVPDPIKDRLPPEYQQPLLTRAISGRVFFYNSELYDKCPFSNWWDLTEPEWKGKVVMNDPITEIYSLAFMTMAALHGDDLAKAYTEKYGQPPKLDPDTPNAGYLWLKRIAQNDPVLAPSQRAVEAIGAKGMKEAPVAMATYFYYFLGISGQLAIKPCLDLKPVSATLSQNMLGIINRAPHPNAAKLFILFALQDPRGSQAMTKVGQYPTLQGMPSPKGNVPLEQMLKTSWMNDLPGIYANMPKVQDFWVQATAR